MQALSLILIAGVLLRELGDADYARWQYAMAIFSVFTALTWFLGNELVTVKLYQSGKKTLVKNFFIIKALICIVFSILYLGYAFLYSEIFFLYFSILTCWVILIKEAVAPFVSLYQYESRYEWVLIANIVSLIARVGCVFLIIFSELPNHWIGLAWLIEVIIFTFMIYGNSSIKIKWRRKDWIFSMLILKKNFVPAFKVWVTVVAGIAFLKFDKISLSSMLNYEEYSIYSSSSQINENALSVVALAMNVIGPYYLYKFKDKVEGIKRFYNTIAGLFFFLVCFAILMCLLQDVIGLVIFGSEKYTQHLWKLIIMAPLYGVVIAFNYFFFRHNEFNHTVKKSLLLICSLYLMNSILKKNMDEIESMIVSMYFSLFVCVLYDVAYFIKWRK